MFWVAAAASLANQQQQQQLGNLAALQNRNHNSSNCNLCSSSLHPFTVSRFQFTRSLASSLSLSLSKLVNSPTIRLWISAKGYHPPLAPSSEAATVVDKAQTARPTLLSRQCSTIVVIVVIVGQTSFLLPHSSRLSTPPGVSQSVTRHTTNHNFKTLTHTLTGK